MDQSSDNKTPVYIQETCILAFVASAMEAKLLQKYCSAGYGG